MELQKGVHNPELMNQNGAFCVQVRMTGQRADSQRIWWELLWDKSWWSGRVHTFLDTETSTSLFHYLFVQDAKHFSVSFEPTFGSRRTSLLLVSSLILWSSHKALSAQSAEMTASKDLVVGKREKLQFSALIMNWQIHQNLWFIQYPWSINIEMFHYAKYMLHLKKVWIKKHRIFQ